MTINAADEYAKIIVASKEAAFLPIAEQILSAKVCPRCCLRHAGVRGDIYATTAPTAPELLSALQALGAGSSPSQPAQDVSASADDPGTASNGHAPAPSAASKSNSEPIGARQSAPSSPSGRPPAAAQAAREADGRCGRSDGPADARAGEHSQDRPCSVCLGVLQTVGSLTPASPSEDVTAAVQQWDSSSGRAWHPSASCCPVELARSAKALGHAGEAFRLEVVLPGAVQVREQALWHWLRRSDSARACFAGHAPAADVVSVKDALRLAVAPTLAAGLGKALREDADLCLCLLFVHPPSATEADFLLGLKPRGRGAKRKKGQQPTSIGKMANENLAQLAAKMVESHFNTHARIPPLAPAQAPYAFFSCLRNLQYIAGFYRKLSRDISHTPFFVVGQRLGRTSVQEVLEALLQPDLRFSHAKFMSAGREDLDVRMLGRGRPFVLELANALGAMPPQSRLQELQEQLAASGAGVEVLKLQAAPKSILKAIKDGEGEKQKSYLARCRLPFPVTDAMLAQLGSMKDVVLQQTTPARVEHRRAMLVRGKTIHEMRAERDAEDPSGLLLHLRTQAGTYIKEFVHSDEGRTVPNLGSLLGCQEPAQILELDVLEIHMPFLT